MTSRWLTFWRDERGVLLSAELLLIATIVVLSLIVGLSELSWAVQQELKDLSRAVRHLPSSPAPTQDVAEDDADISLVGVPPRSEGE
ncbi:MAG: hypothetical protein KatS3mg114_0068 [Planctomycetaceae bacterium]|nr:MAG: hypothetical protein KatS3mg114_0068 [Planctomycetaceae bacterium]